MTRIRATKQARILCTFLFALQVSFAVRAADATGTRNTAGRLTPIVDFTLRTGTNRPISSATAKAFGLGDDKLPAMQVGILPVEVTEVRFFGVSTRNTNDLFVALIDKDTRS